VSRVVPCSESRVARGLPVRPEVCQPKQPPSHAKATLGSSAGMDFCSGKATHENEPSDAKSGASASEASAIRSDNWIGGLVQRA